MMSQANVIMIVVFQSMDTSEGEEVASMSTLFITNKLLGIYIYIYIERCGDKVTDHPLQYL